MHWINWLIVVVYLVVVVGDSLRRTRGTKSLEGFFLAGRKLPWWAVGLSVMATQLSAITLIGTTGQGSVSGLRFVQFYFGLPIAMVILGVTLVPFLHGAKVYTAYEFLERRFDPKTRTLTALLFLLSRGMSCGTILAAPSVVLSAVFGWDLWYCVLLMGIPTVLYTTIGGVEAVAWADVKQMAVVLGSLVAVVVVLAVRMPVPIDDALRIAGSAGRMQVFDFSFSLTETYTFWSGLIGGTFLMLSYFGTDQSQVQRYLAARSVDEARTSLLMSAYWKIPLQALVLLIGVLVFLFFTFTRAPMLYNPRHDAALREKQPAQYAELESRYTAALAAREQAARDASGTGRSESALSVFREQNLRVDSVRNEALAAVTAATGENSRDVNFIVPRLVLGYLPLGLAGLFLAAVIGAAMSAIAAELNSLATASTVDFYRRWVNANATDQQYLKAGRVATLLWGVFACGVAVKAATLGSLIEVVNRFGSFFYGSILGVFLLAMNKRASALGAFVGLLAGMSTVAAVSFGAPQVSFLWHNVIGAVAVVVVGGAISLVKPTQTTPLAH
jgi:SSS family transporter